MAEVLLIYPYIGDMDAIQKNPNVPLPLIQAACLVARHYQVSLMDVRIEGSWRGRLERELEKKPLYVALSVITGKPVASALEISRFVKQRSSVPVVWGGIHPTLNPAQTLADPAVDVIVIGEGEETLLEISDRLSSRKSLHGVAGAWFSHNGSIVQNEPRPPVDLMTLPPAPYHLVDVSRYVYSYRGSTFISAETSRGCHNHCRYCYHTSGKGHHHFRALDPGRAEERVVKAAEDCGVNGVFIVDDNFFINKERGLEFGRRLRDRPGRFPWMIGGVDVPSMLSFSPQELELLEESGLCRIAVGAESGSARTLSHIRKPQTVDMLLAANRLWSPYNIHIFYSWMAGLPGETMEDLKKTLGLMLRITKENPHARTSPLYNFIPFPGTQLWDEVVEKHGFVPPDTLEKWGAQDWSHVNVPYVDPAMKRSLNNLYFPSLFLDDKFKDYAVPSWIAWGARAYRPFARARMKTGFFGFPVEKWGARAAEYLLSRSKRS